MPSFESLPNEVLDQIVGRLTCRRDIGNVRLVNRFLNTIAKPSYFASVALYPHWEDDEDLMDDNPPFPNNIEYDVANFKNILDDDGIRPLVKSVDIYTCNPDCNHRPDWCKYFESGDDDSPFETMPERWFNKAWDKCFNRLPEFPNLDGVSLIFDRNSAPADENSYDNECLLQSRGDRREWLEKVLNLMGPRIKHLGLRHYQDVAKAPLLGTKCCHRRPEDEEETNVAFAKSNSLRESVLGRLESLEMSMIHEDPIPEAGTTLSITDIHACWQQFPTRWLAPAPSTLRRLEIYSDVAVGWYPKLDLRGIHFPHLQSLGLGHFIFQRDQQFDWIVSHGQTLKELFLDRCSILYQVGHADARGEAAFDEDLCPLPQATPPNGEYFYSDNLANEIPSHFFSYSKRWHQIFNRFSAGLPKLVSIQFGCSSQWNLETRNRVEYEGTAEPLMPWRAHDKLANDMFEDRYVVFSGWGECYWPSWRDAIVLPEPGDDASEAEMKQYQRRLDYHRWGTRELDDLRPEMEERPACDEEDLAAFQALLRKIGQA